MPIADRWTIHARMRCRCTAGAGQGEILMQRLPRNPSTAAAPARAGVLGLVHARLRQSAGVRSCVYIAGAILIAEGVRPLLRRTSITDPAAIQLTMLVVGTAWTYVLLRLEDRPLSPLAFAQRQDQVVRGVALGGCAFLAVAALARERGWLQSGGIGWEQASLQELIRSLALVTVTHAAYAWNEELVFRGYGYEVTRAAIGTAPAALMLTALFAIYHPWRAQVLFGEAALGLALLALRGQSGDIWLPMGYHWAWNVSQTALLGPADGPPSLFPIVATGPYLWVGRPGYPEPGLLMAGINLLVALLIAVATWHDRRRSVQPT